MNAKTKRPKAATVAASPAAAMTDTQILDWIEANPNVRIDRNEAGVHYAAHWRVRFSWKDARNRFPTLRAAVIAYVSNPDAF